jgi:anaerobic magnesium-protoporphyrin IX monomethyl ester cyclase
MKICIAYPPILKNGKYPLLGQNRQFRYSSSEAVRIYPIVPATAATLLHQDGYDILFLDGINKRLTMDSFEEKLKDFDLKKENNI